MRYLFEDYALDTDRRELCRRGNVVRLEPQALDLLEYLIRNRERVVSRDDLIAAIWRGRIVSDSAMTTRINAARYAIGDTGKAQRLIKTVPRKGFAGEWLAAFKRMLAEARRLAETQPDCWQVSIGTQILPVQQELWRPLNRETLLDLIAAMERVVARAEDLGRPVVCFGD